VHKVILFFHCQPGKGIELLDIFSIALVETRAYDGCISVETFVDADHPDLVMLFEEWDTRTHNDRYMAWRIETGLAEMLQPILAGPLEIHHLEPRPA
jgi:quinol monooxygenase YgiN